MTPAIALAGASGLPGIQRDQCSAQAQRGNRAGKGGGLVDERGVDHVAVDGMAPGAVAVAHSFERRLLTVETSVDARA